MKSQIQTIRVTTSQIYVDFNMSVLLDLAKVMNPAPKLMQFAEELYSAENIKETQPPNKLKFIKKQLEQQQQKNQNQLVIINIPHIRVVLSTASWDEDSITTPQCVCEQRFHAPSQKTAKLYPLNQGLLIDVSNV